MTTQKDLGAASAGGAGARPSKGGGPYGWLTPFLAAIAARNSDVSSRLLFLSRGELHFIALTLALMGERREDANALEMLAAALGREPRETILARAAPDAEPRLARLAGKLGGKPWRPPTYHALAALHAEPHARKVLTHLPVITRRAVMTLARLPAPYRTRGVLKMIGKPDERARVLFAIEIVRRVRTDLTDRQIIASLERAKAWRIREWVEAHYERLPFPPPPAHPVTDRAGGVLLPVDSGAALRRTGLDYDNCVRSNYLLRAWRGESAFYRYERDGARIAAVEVRRTPGVGWAIEEISGPGNSPVAGKDRIRIIEAFAAAGVAAAPQAKTRQRWLDLE
jgi:hypothetical protein